MPVSILRSRSSYKIPQTRRTKRVIFSLEKNMTRLIPRRKTRKSSH